MIIYFCLILWFIFWNDKDFCFCMILLIFSGMTALLLPSHFGNGLLNLSSIYYWLGWWLDLGVIVKLIIFCHCCLFGLQHLWYRPFTSWHVQNLEEIWRHTDYWKLFGEPSAETTMKTKKTLADVSCFSVRILIICILEKLRDLLLLFLRKS